MKRDPWHLKEGQEVVNLLEADDERGLSLHEANLRLERTGPNRLREKPRASWLERLLAQFQDFMILVLLGATVISFLLGEIADGITILAIVFLNAILGFVQENRAERSLDALQKLSAPKARVRRGGSDGDIPAEEVVPGDLVFLETGDRVPADLRLLHVSNLEIDEANLTGESLPVHKDLEALSDPQTPLGDQKNMAFSGTVVTRGRGWGIAVATGMATEMGHIAGLIQEAGEEATPLQKRLEQLGKFLLYLCLIIAAVVTGVGILQGEPIHRMFLTGVSLAVAAIPEGLPAIVTMALALGVQKMIRRRAIIRKLPAVETLGCATVICSDKTGTLTQNQMTVRRLYIGGEYLEVSGEGYDPQGEILRGTVPVQTDEIPGLTELLLTAALCNNSRLEQESGKKNILQNGEKVWRVKGDPTEGALLALAHKGGIQRETVEKTSPREGENPFDSTRKRMSVLYRYPGNQLRAFVKGAPDQLLERCNRIHWQGEVRPLTPELRAQLVSANETLGQQSFRVLGLAYRVTPEHYEGIDLEADLVFVGLAAMIDPPRPSARKAVEISRQAGIRTVMITGDHPLTAQAIARDLTIWRRGQLVLTGKDLDAMDDRELGRAVADAAVFARVSPTHKLRIVRALKAQGEVVAMTGDGVNDAPAVKEADIGVAMGRSGTEVTKEASAMILADDNFATIVAAVEEGRAIYDNIRKFIRYLLACNLGEVLTMFLTVLFAFPLPLLPIQILYVNLITDGLPAMALGFDNGDPDVMQRRPRHPKESIFSEGLGWRIISWGFYIGLATLVVFAYGIYLGDLTLARTMAFTALVMTQLFHVFDCRSERFSIFRLGFFSNPYLMASVILSVAVHLVVLYVPFFQEVFKTVPLDGSHWLVIMVVAGGRTFLAGLWYMVSGPVKNRVLVFKS